jgi:hypothetical protein
MTNVVAFRCTGCGKTVSEPPAKTSFTAEKTTILCGPCYKAAKPTKVLTIPLVGVESL